jgi:hypothetical protein
MKNLKRTRTSDDGLLIEQELKYNTRENDYEVITTVEGEGVNYKGFASLAWQDSKTQKHILDDEMYKAEKACEAKQPTQRELLFNELGFKEIEE